MIINRMNNLRRLSKYLLLLFIVVIIGCSVKNDITVTNNGTAIRNDEIEGNKYIDVYTDLNNQIDESKLVNLKSRDSSIEDCESIIFGRYEIDGNLSNGLENIEWVLVDIDKDNNEAILLSKYVLDYKPYLDAAYALKNKYYELNDIYNSNEYYEWINNESIDEIRSDIAKIYGETSEKVSWETSTLRDWLNNEFYNTAFSKGEKSVIKKKELVSKRFETNYNTTDNVFCIDVEDLPKYFNCDEAFDEKWGTIKKLYYTKSTRFATKVIEATEESKEKAATKAQDGNYWFRSMNTLDAYTARMVNVEINFFAPISYREKCAANVESRDIGVRPAICIDLSLETIKERSTKLVEGFDNKIKFNERMFGSKKTKSDEKLKKNVAENEEDVDYYYTGGKWN